MVTDKIKLTGNSEGMDEALNFTEQVADFLKLGRKEGFYLRLLTEEMLGMVKAITGDFIAEFWLETEGRKCRLNLEAKTSMDYTKRRELLSVSTSGGNIAPRGIMEKIRAIFESGLYSMEESFDLQAQYGVGMYGYKTMGMIDAGISGAMYSWSMQKYKSGVEAEREDAPDDWDELEKSIIANVADEVQVGVLRDKVKLIVEKTF